MIRRALAVGRKVVLRSYALALLVVVGWTGYTAVAYLVRSVFRPVHVPSRFLSWQTALDSQALRTGTGQGATFPRAPLSHYHHFEHGFQPDPHNGCTTSGCHSPLPHRKKLETRAFANFHATFLTCQMCHLVHDSAPLEAAWIDLSSGRVQDPPAMLRLTAELESISEKLAMRPVGVRAGIGEQLREVLRAHGPDALLEHLLARIETSEPGSPVWNRAVEQLAGELPDQTPGEYAARLAPRPVASDYLNIAARLRSQAQEYLAAAPGSPLREQLHKKIHGALQPQPDACLACHGGEPPLVDFRAVGYPPGRAAQLRNEIIARQMQQIREGRPFYIPRILEGADGNRRP